MAMNRIAKDWADYSLKKATRFDQPLSPPLRSPQQRSRAPHAKSKFLAMKGGKGNLSGLRLFHLLCMCCVGFRACGWLIENLTAEL